LVKNNNHDASAGRGQGLRAARFDRPGVRMLRPYVTRVIIANLQVKAIAYARIKIDKIDAGVLASLHAPGFLPEVWLPDVETDRLCLVARCQPSRGIRDARQRPHKEVHRSHASLDLPEGVLDRLARLAYGPR
jgi:hypothetical protein